MYFVLIKSKELCAGYQRGVLAETSANRPSVYGFAGFHNSCPAINPMNL